MYFRLMGKLNARRNGLIAEDEKGFTLIELLVVVIIIGILAAIAIPVYLSVQNNSKNSAAQTDVTNLKTAVVSLETDGGALPLGSITLTGADSATTLGAGAPLDTNPASTSEQTWTAAGATISKYTTTLEYYEKSSSEFFVCAKSSTNQWWVASDSQGVEKADDDSDCHAAG